MSLPLIRPAKVNPPPGHSWTPAVEHGDRSPLKPSRYSTRGRPQLPCCRSLFARPLWRAPRHVSWRFPAASSTRGLCPSPPTWPCQARTEPIGRRSRRPCAARPCTASLPGRGSHTPRMGRSRSAPRRSIPCRAQLQGRPPPADRHRRAGHEGHEQLPALVVHPLPIAPRRGKVLVAEDGNRLPGCCEDLCGFLEKSFSR